jgi:hypothetical protein
MAYDEHVALLKQGVPAWNKWRRENPDIHPDLHKAKLRNLRKSDLRKGRRSSAISEQNRPTCSPGSVKLWLILAGVVGALLTPAPVLLPKYQEYLPLVSAFSLAWVFNWYYGPLFFLGALVALRIERRKPAAMTASPISNRLMMPLRHR